MTTRQTRDDFRENLQQSLHQALADAALWQARYEAMAATNNVMKQENNCLNAQISRDSDRIAALKQEVSDLNMEIGVGDGALKHVCEERNKLKEKMEEDKACIAALNQEAAHLKASYDAMRGDRNLWMDRYHSVSVQQDTVNGMPATWWHKRCLELDEELTKAKATHDSTVANFKMREDNLRAQLCDLRDKQEDLTESVEYWRNRGAKLALDTRDQAEEIRRLQTKEQRACDLTASIEDALATFNEESSE